MADRCRLGASLAGSWDQATGTIVFMIQKSFQRMSSFTLTFELMNPPAEQAAVSATIQASGPGLIISATPMEGAVLQSGDEKKVYVPVRPTLPTRSLGESSKVEFQETQLLFDLAAGLCVLLTCGQ
jgi:hypothetical protein